MTFRGGLTDPWAAPVLSPCCKRMVLRGTRVMRGEGEGGVGLVNEGREARRRLPERGVLRTGSRGAFTACFGRPTVCAGYQISLVRVGGSDSESMESEFEHTCLPIACQGLSLRMIL